LTAIGLRHLLTLEVAVRPPLDLGGGRRYIPLGGGRFEGMDPGLQGEVLEGGVDWQWVRSEGLIEIDAHYALRTDSGSGIEVRSSGVRRMHPSVAERLGRGEPVDPAEYYFRTHVRLATADAALDRLNGLIAVSTGTRRVDAVRIEVHEVL
jgi:hypothetical protein